MITKKTTQTENYIDNKKLIVWVLFLYIIYLLFKTPIDLHNLGLKNIETYYLSDGFLMQDGYKLYKDIFCNKGPLQILFYAFSLFSGEQNETAIIRVRIFQSITYLISLLCLTFSANYIFRNITITLLTPFIYIYTPIIFKGLWGRFDLQGAVLAEGELLMSPFISLGLYFLTKFAFKEKKWIYILFQEYFHLWQF